MPKRIFLGLSGSVAAVKLPQLYGEAAARGAEVRWHATRWAMQFVLKSFRRLLGRTLDWAVRSGGDVVPVHLRLLLGVCVSRCESGTVALASGREPDLCHFDPAARWLLSLAERSDLPEPARLFADIWLSRIEGVDVEGVVSDEKGKVLHVNTAQWADVALVAPASANTLSKIASGSTDSFLLEVVRAVPRGRLVYVAPAMNTEMWYDPAVQRSLNLIRTPEFAAKYRIIDPIEKVLQCGTTGIGAMEEPDRIIEIVFGQT